MWVIMYHHIISRKIIGYHEIQYFLKVLNLIDKEIFVLAIQNLKRSITYFKIVINEYIFFRFDLD